MTELHPRIRSELTELRDRLSADGTIPPASKLQEYHDRFRREFGPEVLRSLNGQDLLEWMHDHGNRNGLAYWLEFKSDDTFPPIFGSIAGGSALKFGVYRRAETGTWASKGEGSAPKDIPIAEAIRIATTHRDQLIASCEALAHFAPDGDDAAYLQLQGELTRVAPDVENTAWGHKYLALIFPAILDDFHVFEYQRYNLIRVLQLPPQDRNGWPKGRYICAGRFSALAQELGFSLHDTTTALNRRHGPPKSYWRIGTTDDPRVRGKFWPLMRDGEVVAIGWPELGDLSAIHIESASKDAVTALLRERHSESNFPIASAASQIFSFVRKIAEGDRVVASDGGRVLGIGEITGHYLYDPSSDLPHQRSVRWCSLEEWSTVDAEPFLTAVAGVKDPRNLVAIERRILDDSVKLPRPASPGKPIGRISERAPVGQRNTLQRLDGIPGSIQSVLERKGQVVLYGPPGTGKTYWALRTARELASLRRFGRPYNALDPSAQTEIDKGRGTDPPLIRLTSFHPEFGYEDFIEGYRPQIGGNGSLVFKLERGIFRQICTDAVENPALDFYLIIDEINRGDIPRIFGELLTLLERDKRGEELKLPASGEKFVVPTNVFLIGTMNTADRSIALFDAALRRRFGFVELMPDYAVLRGVSVEGLPLAAWLEYLNRKIREFGGGDARNRQIGHAFLLHSGAPLKSMEQLAAVLREEIVPLLEEYAYDDFNQLAELLGVGLVDVQAQRIRRELFGPDRIADLVAALSRPEIATATETVLSMPIDNAGVDEESESGGDEDASYGPGDVRTA